MHGETLVAKGKSNSKPFSGRVDILALEGQRPRGLGKRIKPKGLREYTIIVQSESGGALSRDYDLVGSSKHLSPGVSVAPELDLNERSFSQQDLERIRFQQNKLMHCNFSSTHLRSAVFKGCDLSGATFLGADLRECILDGCNLDGVDLRECNLQGARIIDCNLFAANFDHSLLRGAAIEGCSMGAQSFHNASCQGLKLSNSHILHGFFDDADLSGAELNNVIFRSCTLSNTHFENALLESCQFRGCDSFQDGPVFSGSALNNIMMMDCEFQEPKLVRTLISNSVITRVAMESALFEGTHFDKVIFHEGELKECYSLEEGPVFSLCKLDHITIDHADLCNARFDKSSFIGAFIRDSDFSSWSLNHTGLDGDTTIEWDS